MKKALIIILVCILLLSILFWGGSILKCEILSRKYVHQFIDAYKENTILSECETIKVLEYTETTACVYYITQMRSSGNILYFERSNANSEWEFVNWNVIWSKHGSADGFVWPYIR